MPLLYLYGERDEIVPRRPTELMIAHLPPASRGVRRIAWLRQRLSHADARSGIAVVMGDIASWIAERRAPLPSAPISTPLRPSVRA